MRIVALLLFAILFLPNAARAESAWTTAQAENLLHWISRAPGEGLTLPPETRGRLRLAIDAGDLDALDPVADEAALILMRAWRGRCCGERRPAWWNIDGQMSDEELNAGLADALEADGLDLYLRSIRPSHPQYERLIDALAKETDPDRRRLIELNLARWRWLPAHLGDRYLLVNIASQQLSLWERGQASDRWRVIVGRPITRTPVFTTEVSGLVLNPWWEIPSSIAAEGIASFVRRNPSLARERGYIYQHGRYRQMPGDNNALGRVKLVMPNPYSVFLHDTSNRELFAEEDRFFSHGCIRVDRALSFAATLLERDGWDVERVELEVAIGETQTVPLSEIIRLYVTYFTAEVTPSGELLLFDDVYRRDRITPGQALQHGEPGAQSGSGLFRLTSFGSLGNNEGCAK